MTFSNKVKLLTSAAILIPLFLTIGFNYSTTKADLQTLNEQRLQAVRAIKYDQILSHFNTALEGFSLTLEVTKLQSDNLGEANFELLFERLNERLGFYDIFVINEQGDVVFTVEKESDYQSNLQSGPYKESGLGKLYQQALSSTSTQFVDFAPYSPSNNEPAAFVGKQLKLPDGLWIIAAQLSIDKINDVMQQRSGMGDSGESYLIGPDFRMRSDSFLDPTNRSISASFSGSIERNGVTTMPVQAALSGKTGTLVALDYNNNLVLSAYTPIEIFGIRWALMTEIDVAEINAPISALVNRSIFAAFAALAFSLLMASLFKKMVLRPIGDEPERMRHLMTVIASGDLSSQIQVNEDISLKAQLANVQIKLGSMIRNIVDYSTRLATTAEELSAVTLQSSQNLNIGNKELELSVNSVSEIAATIIETSNLTQETASNTKRANEFCRSSLTKAKNTVTTVNDLVQRIKLGSEDIQNLVQGIGKIVSVLDVIRAVSEQTNLLALNAAIEAARAGENGRGFAVVADEVRSLAYKTQQSTVEIELLIKSISEHSAITVNSIKSSEQSAVEVSEAVMQVGSELETITSLLSNISIQNISISAATEQQSAVATDITRRLIAISDLSTQNATGAEQTQIASLELADLVAQLNDMTHEFKL